MIDYQFKNEFSCGKADADMVTFITIPAPNGKMSKNTSIIEEEMGKTDLAMAKMARGFSAEVLASAEAREKTEEKKDAPKKTDEEKAKDVYESLKMWGADLDRCYNALKDCLQFGGAKYNDSMKLNRNMVDEMPLTDLRMILGLYIVNFINSSE